MSSSNLPLIEAAIYQNRNPFLSKITKKIQQLIVKSKSKIEKFLIFVENTLRKTSFHWGKAWQIVLVNKKWWILLTNRKCSRSGIMFRRLGRQNFLSVTWWIKTKVNVDLFVLTKFGINWKWKRKSQDQMKNLKL
jgi:hypothetical protein